MPRTVCLDSMICVWGVKKKPTQGQEHKVVLAEALFENLKKEDAIILLPAPVVTEILSPIPPKDRPEIYDKIDKIFRIAPFDAIASVKAAELWHNLRNWKDIYKAKGEEGMKNRFKYDLQIAAIAITRGVNYLYTEDQELQKMCKAYIEVGPMPTTGIQYPLFDKKKDSGQGTAQKKEKKKLSDGDVDDLVNASV